ncbi:putative protein kinase [Septoria linicola]|nr:putative protein kinase [Septoria linicola]
MSESPVLTPSSRAPETREEWRFEPLSVPTEWIESYRPGGVHPVHLDDMLHAGRYKVIRKLGYGAFSTVWLAQDWGNEPFHRVTRSQSRNEGSAALAAIKISCSGTKAAVHELEIHNIIQKAGTPDHLSKHIVLLRDSFETTGPNGTHLCLVSEPMGADGNAVLEALRSSDDSETHYVRVKSILKQILLGLHGLHSCGIVHSDLNPGNLLVALSSHAKHDVASLVQKPEEGEISPPVRRKDGKVDKWAPRYLCINRPLESLVDLSGPVHVKISDLGAAFKGDNPPDTDKLVTPEGLRAPEIILGGKIAQAVDVWTFGCLMFEFITGDALFPVSSYGETSKAETDDEHLLQMIDALGQLPPKMFAQWPQISDVEIYRGQSLEQMLEEQKPEWMSGGEVEQVLAILRRLLQYESSLRPSAAELLEDDWFKAIVVGV